jgi:branched-chain amino acid transport system substrate-binding protein
LCFESLEGALKPLSDAGIPALTLSVRAPSLMEDAMKKKWPFFRLAPSQDDERQAITDTIYRLWSNEPFAILDDGTIMSRDTAETVREALEQKGLKPGFTDTFRPTQEVQAALVRRLSKAGVTRVFAAADRQDMAVMAHDAKRLKIPLTFLGGDAVNGLDQDAPMEAGVLAITLPDPATLPSAKTEVAELEKAGGNADGYTLPAYAAVSLLLDAREIATGSGAAISEALVDTPFDTVIGKIRFGKDHELADNPFRLMEWDGKAFVPTNGNSQ